MYMYTPKTISNVTLFNNYIYLNISKTKNICNETLNEYIKYLNKVHVNHAYTDDFDTYYTQLSKMLIYKDKDLEDPIRYSSYLEGLLLFNGNLSGEDGTGSGWKFIDNICDLYLIGTPEDVEELSMFPGIFIREVYDKTFDFIFDNDVRSTLYSKSQLIIYKIGTYYASEPKWWNNIKDIRYFREQDYRLYDIQDVPYSECPAFRKPSLSNNGIIYPCYKQHLNPDERVYKICIQMTDNLIRKSYERSNFFIIIRNQKEKMSIKNFIKYLS